MTPIAHHDYLTRYRWAGSVEYCARRMNKRPLTDVTGAAQERWQRRSSRCLQYWSRYLRNVVAGLAQH